MQKTAASLRRPFIATEVTLTLREDTGGGEEFEFRIYGYPSVKFAKSE